MIWRCYRWTLAGVQAYGIFVKKTTAVTIVPVTVFLLPMLPVEFDF
jgi:hypothetical protein